MLVVARSQGCHRKRGLQKANTVTDPCVTK